jgi:hypothetical protein
MMEWIKVAERLPREDETLNGRVPVVDDEGHLGYALLIDNQNQKPWLMTEFNAVYWLPVPQVKK